jgi:hypothetical protein
MRTESWCGLPDSRYEDLIPRCNFPDRVDDFVMAAIGPND